MSRIEYDSLGPVEVEDHQLWKAQTQRSLIHFPIGHEKMPRELIHALIQIKKAYAHANLAFQKITEEQSKAIIHACDVLLKTDDMTHFPLTIWQTGSGTQTNMNANEVISTIALKDANVQVHPNDHVNASQSSNDVFPSAIHMMSYTMIEKELLPSLEKMVAHLSSKQAELSKHIKLGRTHLQDATPIMVGQELGAYHQSLAFHHEQIKNKLKELAELALGATAVGTGLNCPKGLADKACEFLDGPYHASQERFWSLSYKDALTSTHSSLKDLATSLYKMANDLRLLASGPRSGLGEYRLPANEPGSSIMPGKVNPTQCEALCMVAVRVMGNDTTMSLANSQGQFQLNTMMPVIAYTMNQSIRLLTDVMNTFCDYALKDLQVNENKLKQNVQNSLMLVTVLAPEIGYEKASQVAHYAHHNDCSLVEALIHFEYMAQEEAEKKLDPIKLITDA